VLVPTLGDDIHDLESFHSDRTVLSLEPKPNVEWSDSITLAPTQARREISLIAAAYHIRSREFALVG
jgi:hypothetical protein